MPPAFPFGAHDGIVWHTGKWYIDSIGDRAKSPVSFLMPTTEQRGNTTRKSDISMKLLHGDCLQLMKDIPDGAVDLIVTDPPYFLGMTHNGKKGTFFDLAICRPFYEQLAREYARVLKETGEFYIFTDWRGYAFYYPVFSDVLPVKNLIVWDKISGAGNFYAYTHEFIIYGTMCNKNKKGTNVWREKAFSSGAKKTNGEKVHPTQKPVELIEKIILSSSAPGDTVLDTFMGSGTTGVACKRNGRHFIGHEIDKKYFDMAQERIEGAGRQ